MESLDIHNSPATATTILAKLNRISDQHIETFRQHVKRELLTLFDGIPKTEQLILAFIHSLTLQEQQIIENQETTNSLGIHELKSHLSAFHCFIMKQEPCKKVD